MKNVLVGALVFILISCASQKVDEVIVINKSDYALQKAYSKGWMGGVPGSSTGLDLYIPTRFLGDPVNVEKVYYNNMVTTSVEYVDVSRAMVVAHFKNPEKIMSANSEDEYGNLPPNIVDKIKGLKNDEAMVFYSIGGRKYKKKISNIETKSPTTYPGMSSK